MVYKGYNTSARRQAVRGRGGRRGSRSYTNQNFWNQPEPKDNKLDRILDLVQDLKSRVDKLDQGPSALRKRQASTPNRGEPSKEPKHSNNPDFKALVKELFKHGLVQKSLNNWQHTPNFLRFSIEKLIESIKVPNANEQLTQRLRTISRKFTSDISHEIRQFLRIYKRLKRKADCKLSTVRISGWPRRLPLGIWRKELTIPSHLQLH